MLTVLIWLRKCHGRVLSASSAAFLLLGYVSFSAVLSYAGGNIILKVK